MGHNHTPGDAFDKLSATMVDATVVGSTIGNIIENTDFGDKTALIKELYHNYTVAFVKMSIELARIYDPEGPLTEMQQQVLDALIEHGPMH